jgi:7-keto-8-aminopelargonate synthetase-like enzyme
MALEHLPELTQSAHDALDKYDTQFHFSRAFYCCLCAFPAVPMNKPGLRFTMCRHNELADIEAFVSALSENVQLAAQRVSAR